MDIVKLAFGGGFILLGIFSILMPDTFVKFMNFYSKYKPTLAYAHYKISQDKKQKEKMDRLTRTYGRWFVGLFFIALGLFILFGTY
jgi:cadmium resistance protein CadD (predicted permease)